MSTEGETAIGPPGVFATRSDYLQWLQFETDRARISVPGGPMQNWTELGQLAPGGMHTLARPLPVS